MKQYCRYCCFCFEADDFRCSNHPDDRRLHMTEKQIKRENHCKNFVLSDLGDVITGIQYHPRNNVRKDNKENSFVKFEQLSFV